MASRESAHLFTLALQGHCWLLVCSSCETEFEVGARGWLREAGINVALEHDCPGDAPSPMDDGTRY